jgi:hypothetical protein
MLFDTETEALAGARPEEPLFYSNGSPTRAGWARIRSDAEGYLRDEAATLAAFRDRLTLLFDAMRRDKEPFRRRPNISLRLIAEGEPLAKVIVLPHVRHDPTGGYLVPSEHTVELMEQEAIRVKGEDAIRFRKKLFFRSSAATAPTLKLLYRSAPDDARRIVGTIREFLEDSRVVLARGCDHCAICGRGLTDELSRSRGIGPECIKVAPFLFFAAAVGPNAPDFIVPEAVEA